MLETSPMALSLGQILKPGLDLNLLRDFFSFIRFLIKTSTTKKSMAGNLRVFDDFSKESRQVAETLVMPIPKTEGFKDLTEILPRLTKDKLGKLSNIYNVFQKNIKSTLKPFFDVLSCNQDSQLKRLAKDPKNAFGVIVKLMHNNNQQITVNELGQAIADQTGRSSYTEAVYLSTNYQEAINALNGALSADEQERVSNSLKAFVEQLKQINGLFDQT